MAATDRNSFAEVWDQLDAKYAERVRVTEATALGDEEIVRRWPNIGEGYLSKCVTALSLFTDSSNSKPQLWVKDPVVGREVFPGIYRSVTVDVDVQKPGLKGIIQTLRKGFATAPQWSEARIEAKVSALSNTQSAGGLSGTTSDPVDQVFDVLFPNCSPLAIESIAASLRTANYSSGITVRGEPYAGSWHVISVSTKLEDDGSASATLRIATPQYTISAYDDYGLDRAMDVHYVMDVPKDQAQGIVTAWKAANPVGASASISYSRDQKLVDIVLRKTAAVEDSFAVGLVSADCRYLETETIYLNVADAAAYPILAPANGGGISYVRNVTRNINGTWDISIKARTSRYRDTGFMTVEETGAQKTTQRQQLGLTNQSPEAVVPTAGAVISQRVEIRDDCSKDVTTNIETGKPIVSVEKTVAKAYTEVRTEKTYQAAAVVDPVQAAGYVRKVRNTQSKYPGKYDTLEQEREINQISDAVEYDVEDNAEEHAAAIESIGIKNTGALAVELAASAGEALSATVSYDKESDTLDVRKVVSEGKENIGEASSESNLETSETETKRTTDSADAPDVAAGQIVDFTKRPSRFKDKFDIETRVRTAVPKTTEYTVENEKETVVVTDKLAVDDVAVPVAGVGETVEFSKRPSEFKDKFDIRQTKKTGNQVTIGSHIADYDGSNRQVTRRILLNVPEAAIPVANEKGMRVRVTPTQYNGLVDVDETKVAATAWYLDFDEPTVTGVHPRFNRKVFWIKDSSDIQAYVDAFLAKVAAQTDEQYRISANVGRDENGYYNVDLTATPKESGGSGSEWYTGKAFDIPPCEPRSNYTYASAKVTLTSNAIKVRSLLSGARAGGNLIEHGAGETTGVYYLGRGRYKVVLCYGTDTIS